MLPLRLTAGLVLLLVLAYFTTTPSNQQKYHRLFLSLSASSNTSAAAHLYKLTLRPHSSSTPADSLAAAYVTSILSSSSTSVRSIHYDVLLSFPIHRYLRLNNNPLLPLLQLTYPNDPYASVSAEALPTFHAYAASGSAAGPAVYANYGRLEDFQTLLSLGIPIHNSVVIARYGKIYRGDIVRNAQDAGAAAVVVYSDPADYGGPALFPEGMGMPRTGVQVGSTFRGVGDPTTPGWPSSRDCERVGLEEIRKGRDVPGVPSLPVSAEDGEAILRSIGGQVADMDWQGGVGGLLYRLGPGPGVLNLTYIVSYYILGLCLVMG